MIGIILVIVALIVLGDQYPKIALALAALILLGAVLFNLQTFENLLNIKSFAGRGNTPGGGGRA